MNTQVFECCLGGGREWWWVQGLQGTRRGPTAANHCNIMPPACVLMIPLPLRLPLSCSPRLSRFHSLFLFTPTFPSLSLLFGPPSLWASFSGWIDAAIQRYDVTSIILIRSQPIYVLCCTGRWSRCRGDLPLLGVGDGGGSEGSKAVGHLHC